MTGCASAMMTCYGGPWNWLGPREALRRRIDTRRAHRAPARCEGWEPLRASKVGGNEQRRCRDAAWQARKDERRRAFLWSVENDVRRYGRLSKKQWHYLQWLWAGAAPKQAALAILSIYRPSAAKSESPGSP